MSKKETWATAGILWLRDMAEWADTPEARRQAKYLVAVLKACEKAIDGDGVYYVARGGAIWRSVLRAREAFEKQQKGKKKNKGEK